MSDKKNRAGAIILEIIICAAYMALFIGMQVVCMVILMFIDIFSQMARDPRAWASQSLAQTEASVNEILGRITNPTIILSTFLTLGVLWLFYLIIKKKFRREACMAKFSPVYLPAILMLALGLTFFINTVLNLLPESWLETYMEKASLITDDRQVIVFISTVICAPLMEEIIFRGLILSHLKKVFPVWLAILVSSVAFGLAHGQILWACYACFLGILLSIAKEATGSIFASIIVHMLFNCMGIFIEKIEFFFYEPVFFSLMIIGTVMIPVSILLLYKIKKKKQNI